MSGLVNKYPYKLIRSSRRTLALEINAEGLLVRAPLRATAAEIAAFLQEHAAWIERKLRARAEREHALAGVEKLTRAELEALAKQAVAVLPERVRYYACQVGVDYGTITVRNQRTRWGSCSAKGNLNFNCLLMLMPEAVHDSIIVHELCHRKEMNHSARFYAEVLRVHPQYRECQKWLKEHGTEIMARMPE